MVAYDAHVVDRPGEEDTLARLVAHSRPLRTLRPVVGLFSPYFISFFHSVFHCFFVILSPSFVSSFIPFSFCHCILHISVPKETFPTIIY